jgi:hypothetical protein
MELQIKSLKTPVYAIAFCIIALSLLSCEEQKRVIEPFVPTGDRVVLLEEFTGKGCTNCPKGSREIENLLTLFPDNLVAVSIHAGFFANPDLFPIGQYDLRAPQAQELYNLLGPNLGYPAGVVNRTLVNGDMQIGANQWSSAISRELQTPPAVELSIVKEYNPISRELSVSVTGIAKQDLSGDLRLSVMLTESGIVDAQDDQEFGGIDPNYVHKHVLRTMLTPVNGVAVGTSFISGQPFTQTFSITLEPNWNADEMEIIAFVSNVQGSVFPVLQAVSVHLAD